MSMLRRPRLAWPPPPKPGFTAVIKIQERVQAPLEDTMHWSWQGCTAHMTLRFGFWRSLLTPTFIPHLHKQFLRQPLVLLRQEIHIPQDHKTCSFCAKRSVSFLTFGFLNILSHYLDHAGDHMPSYLPLLPAEFSFWLQEESPWAGGECGEGTSVHRFYVGLCLYLCPWRKVEVWSWEKPRCKQ